MDKSAAQAARAFVCGIIIQVDDCPVSLDPTFLLGRRRPRLDGLAAHETIAGSRTSRPVTAQRLHLHLPCLPRLPRLPIAAEEGVWRVQASSVCP